MRIGVPGEFHEDRWQHSLANHYPTDLRPVSFRCHNRSSARRPCPQVLQSHLRVAKQSSIGPSARRPCPEVSQRHPRVADHPPTDLKTVSFRCHNRSSARRPAHRRLRGSPAWRDGHPSALRHGDPAYRCLSGILAWQSVLLTGLRHGHPAHRCLSGILAEPL